MAEMQTQTSVEQSAQLKRLKKELEGYREILVPLNKVLEWDQSHYPGIIIGIITVLFAIIWYIEPSVLTCFSLIGVMVCLVDFVVPTITSYCFSSKEWTVIQERQFETICIRLLNARTHCHNAKVSLAQLKERKPKAYLVLMMGIFATTAWIGSMIDNLLLTYLLVLFVVMVPGLRKHGILQKFTASASEAFKRLVQGQKEPVKTKIN